ncbi:unnamed protein product [Closterium sp. NIES-65]|nr:unnamed protein product [Closterium sp. NIES-65]
MPRFNRREQLPLHIKRAICAHHLEHPVLRHVDLARWCFSQYGLRPDCSTIGRILKTAERWDVTSDGANPVRRRAGAWPELEQAMGRWIANAGPAGVPLTLQTIRDHVAAMARNMGIPPTFRCSIGWVRRALRRQGVRCRAAQGEAASADMAAVRDAREKMPRLLTQLGVAPRDTFNLDETALWLSVLPRRTYSSGRIPGRKVSKERLTVAFLVNADGSHAFRPLVISKAKRPHDFRPDYDPEALCYWRHNAKGWMTSPLFTHFITHLNAAMFAEGRKIVVLLDNASSHMLRAVDAWSEIVCGVRTTCMSHVRLVFLPPNTTAFTQPLDQGIIATAKARYRQHWLRAFSGLWNADGATSAVARFRPNLRDVLEWLSESWTSVGARTIQRCWWRTGCLPLSWSLELPHVHDDEPIPAAYPDIELDDDIDDVGTLINTLDLGNAAMTAAEYVAIDDAEPTCAEGTAHPPVTEEEMRSEVELWQAPTTMQAVYDDADPVCREARRTARAACEMLIGYARATRITPRDLCALFDIRNPIIIARMERASPGFNLNVAPQPVPSPGATPTPETPRPRGRVLPDWMTRQSRRQQLLDAGVGAVMDGYVDAAEWMRLTDFTFKSKTVAPELELGPKNRVGAYLKTLDKLSDALRFFEAHNYLGSCRLELRQGRALMDVAVARLGEEFGEVLCGGRMVQGRGDGSASFVESLRNASTPAPPASPHPPLQPTHSITPDRGSLLKAATGKMCFESLKMRPTSLPTRLSTPPASSHAPFHPSHSITPDRGSLLQSAAGKMPGEVVTPAPPLRPEAVTQLRPMAAWMLSNGYESSCLSVYEQCRAAALLQCVTQLSGSAAALGPDEVAALSWEERDPLLKLWVLLLVGPETELFRAIINLNKETEPSSNNARARCLAGVVLPSLTLLHSSACVVAGLCWEPQHLFPLLHVVQALLTLQPAVEKQFPGRAGQEVEKQFPGEAGQEVRRLFLLICSSLCAAVRRTISDFQLRVHFNPTQPLTTPSSPARQPRNLPSSPTRSSSSSSTSLIPPPPLFDLSPTREIRDALSALKASPDVLPLTSYLVNFVILCLDPSLYLSTLLLVYGGEEGNEEVGAARVGVASRLLLAALKPNLERMGGAFYCDEGMQAFFLLNNCAYMLHKVAEHDEEHVKQVLGQAWLDEVAKELLRHRDTYIRCIRDKVAPVLWGHQANAQAFTKQLQAFHSLLDAVQRQQSMWSIGNADARASVRDEVVLQVLQQYRDFLDRHRC